MFTIGLLDYCFFENYIGQVLLLLLSPKALKYFSINHGDQSGKCFFHLYFSASFEYLRLCTHSTVGYD